MLEMAPPDAKDPDIDAVRAALALAAEAPSETADRQRWFRAAVCGSRFAAALRFRATACSRRSPETGATA